MTKTQVMQSEIDHLKSKNKSLQTQLTARTVENNALVDRDIEHTRYNKE